MSTDYSTENRKRYSDLYANPYFSAQERYSQFHRRFGPDTRRVLDVGCNKGYGGKALKELAPEREIYGIDAVPEWIPMLKQMGYTEGFCVQTDKMPVADAFFDAIVAGEFIEHLTFRDFFSTLDEWKRILRVGGTLAITTPNPHYLKYAVLGRDIIGGAKRSHYCPKQLQAHLHELGFVNIALDGSGKMTRYLGEKARPLSLYGSYLLTCAKS